MKPRYIPPTVERITDEYIDSIAPLLMSCGGIDGGGGGGSSPSYRTIYVLNTPTGLYVLGHSAILFEMPSGQVELYSFHPKDNKTFSTDGSIASISRKDDSLSFYQFRNACKTGDGILIYNQYKHWCEPFARYIRLKVTQNSFSTMRLLALNNKANPPSYNGLGYNCLHFVMDILTAGGIVLRAKGESLYDNRPPVPNIFHEEADETTTGVISFGKGAL